MPKLMCALGAFVLALVAQPALAQGDAGPAASDSASDTASDTAAPDTGAGDVGDAGAATSDAGADGSAQGAASDDTAPDAAADAAPDAAPASQPAPDGPSTQPAGAASQPAPDEQPIVAADEPVVEEAPEEPAGPVVAGDQPTVMERRLVAYVSTGVAAVAFGTGITLGVLALNQYNCLNDVTTCNEGLEEPILGEAFLDKKAEVETLSLLADMAYVVAAAATIVAVTGYIRGYFLTDEETEVAQ